MGLKRRFILVGLSMGGTHGYIYAARHPERVERLVIVDVGPEVMKAGAEKIRRFSSQQDILPSFEAFVQRAHGFNPRRPLEQLRERLKWSLRELPDGRWSWKYDYRRWRNAIVPGQQRSTVEDKWTLVRRLTMPTLLVRGAKSDIFAADVARRMQREIPNCTLVEIPDAGHTVPGDNPEAFAKAVGEWLGR
jgi:pimeloyl-ACP methyl ester carboxylesterase